LVCQISSNITKIFPTFAKKILLVVLEYVVNVVASLTHVPRAEADDLQVRLHNYARHEYGAKYPLPLVVWTYELRLMSRALTCRMQLKTASSMYWT